MEGQKRCSIYEIFINWNEVSFPCCKYKLGTRSFGGFGMRKKHREDAIKRY